MTIKIFITSTDTDAGKTYVLTGLLDYFNQKKYSTLGIKPVACGAQRVNGHLQNEDALLIQAASSIKLPYHQINPFTFELPISPNIAAEKVNCELSVQTIKNKIQYALQYPADICLIEGAGGWAVPINARETMADFVKLLQLKVILVVNMRLGCINHALLTYRSMLADNIPLIGWIANCQNPHMLALDENFITLQQWLKVPFLGRVGLGNKVADCVEIEGYINASNCCAK